MTLHSLTKTSERHKSPFEKANELIELAKQVTDSAIRERILDAIERYYLVDVTIIIKGNSIVIEKKPDFTKDILVLLLFYVVIFATAFISFSQLGFFLGAGVVIGTYALATLMMGVILRMRGDITQRGLLAMVREGFKALNLLRRH